MTDFSENAFMVDIFRAGPLCAVRVTHLPTGLTATHDESRSSLANKQACFDDIRALLAPHVS